ncbi:MAG: PilZ domain-containing protein [Lachnospiraceae bacterium]|nr:PilZ domain-containing protein [Lachnospiraceae bacterium]
MEEKRKNKRTDLKVTAELSVLGTTGETKIVEADILDLSPTGIGFTCNDTLEIGEVYMTKLKIWTEETISAILKVVRCTMMGDTPVYGGIFVGMENSDILRIQVYQMFSDNEQKEVEE